MELYGLAFHSDDASSYLILYLFPITAMAEKTEGKRAATLRVLVT